MDVYAVLSILQNNTFLFLFIYFPSSDLKPALRWTMINDPQSHRAHGMVMYHVCADTDEEDCSQMKVIREVSIWWVQDSQRRQCSQERKINILIMAWKILSFFWLPMAKCACLPSSRVIYQSFTLIIFTPLITPSRSVLYEYYFLYQGGINMRVLYLRGAKWKRKSC